MCSTGNGGIREQLSPVQRRARQIPSRSSSASSRRHRGSTLTLSSRKPGRPRCLDLRACDGADPLHLRAAGSDQDPLLRWVSQMMVARTTVITRPPGTISSIRTATACGTSSRSASSAASRTASPTRGLVGLIADHALREVGRPGSSREPGRRRSASTPSRFSALIGCMAVERPQLRGRADRLGDRVRPHAVGLVDRDQAGRGSVPQHAGGDVAIPGPTPSCRSASAPPRRRRPAYRRPLAASARSAGRTAW